ncbi:MAG: hypothetical protein AB7I42_24175 [Bradyrhizobium sp.]|uniref:hypothetical protein n=1 Tax=Bradyrhizobium sp. TaxID=376 RepID=UPI003D13D13E
MKFVKLTAMGRTLYVAVDKIIDIFERPADVDLCPGGSNISCMGENAFGIADQSPTEIVNLIKAMQP